MLEPFVEEVPVEIISLRIIMLHVLAGETLQWDALR